ncbi:MAG: protein-L-isoaspartate(D-aspartate) O-methyltransferase [Candidatus Methylomirabilia bacterium]
MLGSARSMMPSGAAGGRFDRERERMVEEQLRRRGIRNQGVLEAMRKVPREQFVEEAFQDRAHGDHPLPIGEGQTISQPYMVALMTELLELTGTEKVLEVGTGSGYQAAVLGELARRVCSIERIPSLAARARATLERLGYTNLWVRAADGTLGWPDEGPFDRVIVTAAAPSVPSPLVDQMAEGGRMVLPLGDPFAQTLMVVEKVGGSVKTTSGAGCVFVKLVGKYGWEG